MHGHADGDAARPRRRPPRGSSHRSGLVSTTTGSAPLSQAEREIALEPAQVEVAVERRHEEDDVHVRGDDLLDRLEAGGLARERRPPRQHGLESRGRPAVGGERDPVADGGQIGAGGRPWRSRPGTSAQISSVVAVQDETPRCSTVTRPARGPIGERGERGGECRAEAQVGKAHWGSLLERVGRVRECAVVVSGNIRPAVRRDEPSDAARGGRSDLHGHRLPPSVADCSYQLG